MYRPYHRRVSWPLTGRAEELRLISGLTARGDGPVGVVIAGPPGVGKTRLARAALAAAQERGATTRWAAATASARELPLGAFTATLSAVGTDPSWLLRQAGDALLAGAGRRGVLVGVDDAHLLDELSATLVHRLVLRREVSVVLTLRSGEPAPDAVTALWKDGHLRRLDLRPMSPEETAELLECALGGPVGGTAAHELWAITRGNPLYLQQLVEGEVDAGRLAHVAGVWRWSGRPQLTPGLVELIQARIGRLSDAQRDVVEVLAFSEPLGVPLLASLTDRDAVEETETRGLIEVHTEGRRVQARLAHPLFGELQRSRCGQLRARRVRGRIAAAIAATGGRRADDTLRRAALAVDSDLPPDADLLTDAAEQAMGLLDPGLAERLAQAALAPRRTFPAQFVLCRALGELGARDDLRSELAALTALSSDDAERSRAAALTSATMFWGLASPTEAEAVLDAALARVADEESRRTLVAQRALLDAVLARPVRAAAAAVAVLASAEPTDPVAVTCASWALATARGGLGDLDGMAAVLQRVDALTDRFELGSMRITGIGNAWTRALRLAGRLVEAEREACGYVERFQDAGGALRHVARALCGQVALDRGRVRTAARIFQETAAELVGTDPPWCYISTMGRALALGMAGDPVAARAAAADMEARRHPSLRFREPDLVLARAWVAAAEGAISEATASARQAAEVAAAQTQPAVEVVALHTAVCFGDGSVAGRLAELAIQVDGPRAPAAAAHAAALAADDGAALAAASQQLADMGAMLLAADAAAQAAVVHARRGRRGSAQAAAARAHQLLAAACEDARTPALAAIGAPMTLTRREREIVSLAAQGLSNRAIAQRLVLSTRTVEGHLYRASMKLGVSDRADLGARVRDG